MAVEPIDNKRARIATGDRSQEAKSRVKGGLVVSLRNFRKKNSLPHQRMVELFFPYNYELGLILGHGDPVELVAVEKILRRGILFYARGTEPFPNYFFSAPQTSFLFPVDDGRARFRRIPRSHDFSSYQNF